MVVEIMVNLRCLMTFLPHWLRVPDDQIRRSCLGDGVDERMCVKAQPIVHLHEVLLLRARMRLLDTSRGRFRAGRE